MKRIIICCILLLSIKTRGFSQAKLQNFDELIKMSQAAIIKASNGEIKIEAFRSNLIRISYQFGAKKAADSSYVVIQNPQATTTRITQNLDEVYFYTDSLYIVINKLDFNIKFFKTSGELITQNTSTHFSDTLKNLDFSLHADEEIYGLGSRAIALNRRGNTLENYHQPHYGYQYGEKNLNIAVPYYTSNHHYGIYIDAKGYGFYDIGEKNKNVLSYATESGDLTYYFLLGSPPELSKNYTWLTGRQPLPPLWALGYIQSRFGYKSQQETLGIVKRTKAAGYPIDATVLDLYWYGDVKSIGNHDWQRDSFPNPSQMIKELNTLGVKTIPITQTFVTKTSTNFERAVKNNLLTKGINQEVYIIKGFWAGPAGLLDIFKSTAQEHLWSFYKKRIDEGVAGWWCDLGEPEQHPDSMRHIIGAAKEVHNIYPLVWSQFIYNRYRDEYPKQRVFTLARSGGAGMQRYATFPWSGDVSRSWEGLRAQIPLMVGAGISGLGYMHSDAGGFAMGVKDKELYIRWMQFSAFTPIFRAHADPSIAAPEPIFWDDTTQSIVKKYIKLRYDLLPYNYTLAAENSNSGRPLALPINYFSLEKKLSNINDEFLWGKDLLIAPVLQQSITKRKVYFPKGEWIDFNTGNTYKDSAEVDLTIKDIPIFARGGSFIPMTKFLSNTQDYKSENLIIKHFYIYDSLQTSSNVFFDDGTNPASIKTKEYGTLKLTISKNQNESILTLVKRGNYHPQSLEFEVVNAPKFKKVKIGERKFIRVSRKKVWQYKSDKAFYDKANKKLYFKIGSFEKSTKIILVK